jgi:hypothetical protein
MGRIIRTYCIFLGISLVRKRGQRRKQKKKDGEEENGRN